MSGIAIRVSNGKYTFSIEPACVLDVRRHGEPWLKIEQGFNAIHSLMCELDAARVVVAAVRKALTLELLQGGPSPREVIEAALARHAGLVDDQERPSAWALPSGPAA